MDNFNLKQYLAENKLNEAEGKDLYNTAGQMISQVGLFTQENADKMEARIKELEALLEKAIQERDYYYNLWKKANAYIVKK